MGVAVTKNDQMIEIDSPTVCRANAFVLLRHSSKCVFESICMLLQAHMQVLYVHFHVNRWRLQRMTILSATTACSFSLKRHEFY